ncbi:MAG: ribonuclease R [Clostridia bacterium]|nr:ribonuclease R [Clostridia bacterium]
MPIIEIRSKRKKMKRTIERKITRQKIYEGQLRGNSRGFAFLVRDAGEDLFIPHRSLNGAQHSDIVKARIVKGDEAEVVSVISRGITMLTGRVEKARGKVFVIPDNESYYTDIILEQKNAEKAKHNTKVLVEIINYDKSGRPIAKILEVLGVSGERNAEILSLLINSGFSDRFSKKVITEAEQLKEDTDYSARKDYREMLTITIDGEDARDFDDAISITKTAAGFTLYVHIADVSHYVREGTLLDAEAYKRATSVYFPAQVFPMLPEKLSNGLCSLRPDEEKMTLTAVLNFDESGDVTGFHAYESVIRSNYRMTYKAVQKILDGDAETVAKYPDLIEMLKQCRQLARKIKDKRAERGSIDFATIETTIKLEGDKVIGVESYDFYESNGIIEEFMIAANEGVARELESRKYPCLYRVHESPTEEKVKTLEAYAGGFGLMPEGKYLTVKDVSAFIRKCQQTEFAKLISDVAVRTMQKAEYRTDNIGHYGLASESYCHFTSPIRRYPDLIVHRMLKLMFKGVSEKQREEIETKNVQAATHCSQMERAAEKAERDVVDYYKAVFMKDHVGVEAEGIISGVTGFAIFVMLPNGIEGMITQDTLPRDSYFFDSKRYLLKGDRNSYRLGDKLKIRVKESNVFTRKVTFELVESK